MLRLLRETELLISQSLEPSSVRTEALEILTLTLAFDKHFDCRFLLWYSSNAATQMQLNAIKLKCIIRKLESSIFLDRTFEHLHCIC